MTFEDILIKKPSERTPAEQAEVDRVFDSLPSTAPGPNPLAGLNIVPVKVEGDDV